MTCSTPGCDRPIKGRGLCSTHHRAALRSGTITPRRVANQDLCPVDGCDRTVRTKGLCHRHYQRQWDAARKATDPRPARPARTSRGGDMTGITDIIVLSRPHDRATLDRALRCLARHDALDLADMLGVAS